MKSKSKMHLIAMLLGMTSIILSILYQSTILTTPLVGVAVVFAALGIGIVAIILGVKGRRKSPDNKSLATAGLITGIIGVVLSGASALFICSCVACVFLVSDSTDVSLSDINDIVDALDFFRRCIVNFFCAPFQ